MKRTLLPVGLAATVAALMTACGGTNQSSQPSSTLTSDRLSGTVIVDGSSTVAPISIAASETFSAENPSVSVAVGTSGSGGGFKKFCVGETDISNASRPIKQSEIETCAASGVEFIEIPVAFDGLAVVVNKENDWAQCVTVEELNTLWNADAEGEITRWSQIRPAFPNEELALFAPGVDSGTFDYFNEAILDEDDIRADFTPSEDDNVIVTGVAGSPGGLGFFGLAFFEENEDILNVLAVDGGDGCVTPSTTTVENGIYKPLARPLFIYVSKDSADRQEVRAFIDFYIENAADLSSSVGYIGLPNSAYTRIAAVWEARETGSRFQDVEPGTPIDDLFGN
ncbi:PstS family phosphate ABC transporter substrate-binding protein [Synechococcus sp. PCC 7336]|uniref:PstS family phosphate ABC transporter substrate-binding protein n=1 Tax=Synechococcus sp. PCC 7336 TaxID=195250 RepID=UPI00034DFC62|nr:PstS family phosphate ABC transporter substrate-binding protein [Synechococcus sp. PCC 7336]